MDARTTTLTPVTGMTPTEIEAGNRKIAEFMGLELVKSEVDWHNPYYTGTPDGIECDIEDLKYHTSFDWFVPVWNKAVKEISMIIKNLPDNELTPALVNIFDATDDLSHEFTISDRLPLLLEIIDFLNQNKK